MTTALSQAVRTTTERKNLLAYSFPKNLSNNLNRRIELLDEARDNIYLQQELYNRCKNDIVFFFNYFLWTFNPKEEPKHFPFLLYPVQADLARSYLEEIQTGKGSLTEKSREVGATYICLGVYLHQFLFGDGFEALLLSLREDEVDNPTESSLFGKLRYMLERLPFWILPFNWSWRKNSKHLTLTNPNNGNSIVGMATTEDAGRSGRKSAVLVDEYASILPRILRGLEMALNETTNCLHRISTPKGINQFKMIRDRKLCIVHTIHWTRIPTKTEGLYYIDDRGKHHKLTGLQRGMTGGKITKYGFLIGKNGRTTKIRVRSPWYDKRCKIYLHERDRAQELDLNYLASGYCRFDAEMIESGSAASYDGTRGRLDYDADGRVKFVESEPGAPFELEVWKFPTEPYYNNRSAAGVDIAEGLEKGDYSSADVLVKDPVTLVIEQAASLHGHFKPDIWTEKIAMLGFWYDQGAELAVERNFDGDAVLRDLRDEQNYTNIFKALDDGKDGFLTKKNNKFTITQDLDEALRTGELIIHSIAHYTELSMFENNNGKLGATGTNHDDRVMSLAIAWHCIMQYGRPKEIQAARKGRKKTRNFDTSRY